MQCQNSFITEGEPVRKIKKLSIPKATDGDLDYFLAIYLRQKTTCVPISLISKYNDSYVPETE